MTTSQVFVFLLLFIMSGKTLPLARQVSAVREGMARVVPVPLLSLFTGPELETMVCGSPDIPLDLLKSVVTYKGVDANAPLVRWFWETLESFSNAERSLFLRFVWGRTRLPRTIVDFRGRDFVFQVTVQCLTDVLCRLSFLQLHLRPYQHYHRPLSVLN